MRLYRIARAEHAQDLSGEGARLYGGRWTPVGYPVLYTAEHPALAAWEVVVHFGLPVEAAPLEQRLITLQVPDRAAGQMPRLSDVPADPRRVGLDWLAQGASLLLAVPSVVIPQSQNVLVNPRHPDMAEVHIEDCCVFAFDGRVSQ